MMYDLDRMAEASHNSGDQWARKLSLICEGPENKDGRRLLDAGQVMIVLVYQALRLAGISDEYVVSALKAYSERLQKIGKSFEEKFEPEKEWMFYFSNGKHVALDGETRIYDVIKSIWVSSIPRPTVLLSLSLPMLWKHFVGAPEFSAYLHSEEAKSADGKQCPAAAS